MTEAMGGDSSRDSAAEVKKTSESPPPAKRARQDSETETKPKTENGNGTSSPSAPPAFAPNDVCWAWGEDRWFPALVLGEEEKVRGRPDALSHKYRLVLWLGDGRVTALKTAKLKEWSAMECFERKKMAERYVRSVELLVNLAATKAGKTLPDPAKWEEWARANTKTLRGLELRGDFYKATRGLESKESFREEMKERGETASPSTQQHSTEPSQAPSDAPANGEKPSRTAGKKKFKSAAVIKAEVTGEKLDYDPFFASAAAKRDPDDWKAGTDIGFDGMTEEEIEYRRRKKAKKERKRREREMAERGYHSGSLFSSDPLKKQRRYDADGNLRAPTVRRQRGAPKDSFTESEQATYTLPLDKGWRRELVARKNIPEGKTKAGDVYYHCPRGGRKLRSRPDVAKIIDDYPGLSLDNFSFSYIPTGHANETDN